MTIIEQLVHDVVRAMVQDGVLRIRLDHHFESSHSNRDAAALLRIEHLAQLILERQIPVNDFTQLQTSLDQLKANVTDVVVPLLQKVAQGSDDSATIAALAKEA